MDLIKEKNSKLVVFKFSEFDSDKYQVLRFGRKQTKDLHIDVCFNDESTSRLHCTINYDKEKGKWSIIDSDGKDKKSLNGTWFLADDEVIIATGTVIRVGTTTLEATIKDN